MNVRTKRFESIEDNDHSGTERGCLRCGKAVKPGRGRWVHIVYGGGTVLHPDDEAAYAALNDTGDVGCHLIGSDCAKRLGLEWSTTE